MRLPQYILILLIGSCIFSCGKVEKKGQNMLDEKRYNQNRHGLTGNNIIEFVKDKNDPSIFTDPIDDITNFKKITDNIYKDIRGKTYILSACSRPFNDTLIIWEYFKEMTDFLDLKTYRRIKGDYFENKGKVYMWWSNSDGNYPIEAIGADPKSFIPFENIAGGIDNQNVFYVGVPDNFKIIKGADPKSIKILNPERGCWNCGNCYFVDCEAVYYGLNRIDGADPKTFKLINQTKIDALDRNGKYYDGHLTK
jgi:hypothetical protein